MATLTENQQSGNDSDSSNDSLSLPNLNDSEDSDDDIDYIDKEEASMNAIEFLTTRLEAAENNKAKANVCFKQKDNTQARDLYLEARKHLDRLKMKHLDSVDSQLAVDKLRAALNSNLSAVFNRMEEWESSIKASTAVLDLDPTSSKALFRRAYAHFHRSVTGSYWKEAKADLVKCLKQDKKNKQARLLYAQVKEKIAARKEDQRKALGGMFEGKSLYSDVDKAKLKKAKEEKKRKADKKQREKELWAKERTRRVDNNEEDIDFEAYRRILKQQKEAEKKEEDEKKEKAREERRKRQRERDAIPVVVDDDDDDTGLLKGYKKTKDGRTTSFFTPEIDEATKALIGNVTPQKIEAGETKNQSKNWEESGTTWVDRDCTKKAETLLLLHFVGLEETATKESKQLHISVEKVTDIEGTCRMIRNAKGLSHMFSFSFKCQWTATWKKESKEEGKEEKGEEGEEGDEGEEVCNTATGWIKCIDASDHSTELESKWGYSNDTKPEHEEKAALVRMSINCMKERLFKELIQYKRVLCEQ